MDYTKATLPRTILFIIATIVFLALAVAGLSRVLAFYSTGTEPGDALNLNPKIILAHTPQVNWLPPHPRVQEDMGINKYLIKEIEEHYVNSWYLNNLSIKNGQSISLDDSYSENPRAIVKASVGSFEQTKELQRVDLVHNISLNWLAPDMQICGLQDTGVVVRRRFIEPETRSIQYEDQLKMDLSVVMTLEDSRWRIRHMVADSIEPMQVHTAPESTYEFIDEIDHVQGINYYPQDYPWKEFWKSFNDTIVERDFTLVSELGFNAVRVFVPYEVFGKGHVELAQVENLRTVLQIAEAKNIKVIVTLFDFLYDFDLMSYSAIENHLHGIVDSIKDYNALLAWDIKNEPDLDFAHYGVEQVSKWLDFVLTTMRKLDPDHYLTIGWLDPTAAPGFHNKVDFISFHYYEDPAELTPLIDSLQPMFNKSILIEEYGLPTYNLLIAGNSDKDQADYYQVMLDQISSQEHVSHALWTLYDFTTIPNDVVGPLPWRKLQQKGFGLIRSDSTHKPAMEIVQQHLLFAHPTND